MYSAYKLINSSDRLANNYSHTSIYKFQFSIVLFLRVNIVIGSLSDRLDDLSANPPLDVNCDMPIYAGVARAVDYCKKSKISRREDRRSICTINEDL